MPTPVLLNSEELAYEFGCCARTIRNMAKDGSIPHIRDERGRIWFNVPAVAAALRKTNRRANQERGGGRMSISKSIEALDFSRRVERTDGLVAKVVELERKLAAAEANRSPADRLGDRIREIGRKQDEFLRLHQERCERENRERAEAEKRAIEVEQARIASEPKQPTEAMIRSFKRAIGNFVNAARPGSGPTYERERHILPAFEQVVDLLLEIRANPFTGWPKQTTKVLQILADEFTTCVGSWGWRDLIVDRGARKGLLDARWREWEQKATLRMRRVAELWVRMYESSLCEAPPAYVMTMGLEARATGIPYGPIEIMPQVLGHTEHDEPTGPRLKVEVLWANARQSKNALPAIGGARPELNDTSIDYLDRLILALDRAMPREPGLVGQFLNGIMLPFGNRPKVSITDTNVGFLMPGTFQLEEEGKP